MYVGGAVGQSQVKADAPADSFDSSSFKENHSAYKFMAGIRPLSPFGVEVAYVDLGHPHGRLGGLPADVTAKGTAAFAVFYLLPVPILDVYAKLGVARLQTTVSGAFEGACNPGCAPASPYRLDNTTTSYALGAGVQVKLGAWAVRGEYEAFDTKVGRPGLATLGVTWTFL
jgi:opacity protein-like surface antigen